MGVDTKSEKFIEAVREHNANVVGMSALLTTTMENIGRTNKAFEETGGAALSAKLAKEMKADSHGRDAVACVEKAKELLGTEEETPRAATGA